MARRNQAGERATRIAQLERENAFLRAYARRAIVDELVKLSMARRDDFYMMLYVRPYDDMLLIDGLSAAAACYRLARETNRSYASVRGLLTRINAKYDIGLSLPPSEERCGRS